MMRSQDEVVEDCKALKEAARVIRDRITAKMIEMDWAADVGVSRSMKASIVRGLMVIHEKSTPKIFLAFVREIAAERIRRVPDTEVWLAFVKSAYLMRGYIPSMREAGLDFELDKETVDDE